MITVREIQEKNTWDTLVRGVAYSPMTQAAAYGDFYASMGDTSFIIGAYEKEKLVGGALVIVIHAKRGSYFYLPYGPIATDQNIYAELLKSCVAHLKNKAREHHVSCIRISPFVESSDVIVDAIERIGFKKSPIHALAETTCILDVTQGEDELMAHMNKNHRNLIRRCEKEGVTVQSFTHSEKLKEFHELHDRTAKRHRFVRFSNEYVEKEFASFEKNAEAVVFYCYLPDGTLDSSAVVYYYGSTAAYRHGASLGNNNKIPTPYLLQWSAILEAKKRGMRWYNFWGVAPEDAKKNHPFKGITHFKKGFGGEVKNLVECHDLIINPITYWPMRIFETLRRIKRGF